MIRRIILLTMALLFTGLSGHVAALSSDDRASIDTDSVYYWPLQTGSCSDSTAGGSVVADTLPASVPKLYSELFTNASAAEHTNPNFLAAIFVTEHGNAWPDPKGPWASSSTGASGPFQFEPGTWQGYKTDGNNDGKTDVQNLADAAYSAAKMLAANGAKPATPLGDLTHPWVPKTLLYVAGEYNAGGGTISELTSPSSPLNAPGLSDQVKNYVQNVYYLISTKFAHGNPGYGSASGAVSGDGGGAAAADSAAGNASLTGDCSSAGAVQGSIVQTAVNLAWDDIPNPKPSSWYGGGDTSKYHGFQQIPTDGSKPADFKYVKPSYLAAADASASASTWYTDCGMFVSSVMRSSGADKNYTISPTGSQQTYGQSHKNLYQYIPSFTSTKDLQVGDILVNSGHTYIYVGKQADGWSVAEASQSNHAPEIDADPYPSQGDGGNFAILRYKAQ